MMAFWDRWFKRGESKLEPTPPSATDRELVKEWIQNVNDSLVGIKEDLQKIPSETAATVNESFEDVLRRIDALPERIIGPLEDIMDLSKREILAELVRISSNYDAHHSHDSISAQGQIETPIQEITKDLTGKQKSLLAILLESGFLSYAEIGEKLGITHESAKNLVNRLLKDTDKARLISKQETDQGIMVGVSSEIQDELLKKKHRTTPNDST
jgi:DNA-binding MarR family transcriptional regulator